MEKEMETQLCQLQDTPSGVWDPAVLRGRSRGVRGRAGDLPVAHRTMTFWFRHREKCAEIFLHILQSEMKWAQQQSRAHTHRHRQYIRTTHSHALTHTETFIHSYTHTASTHSSHTHQQHRRLLWAASTRHIPNVSLCECTVSVWMLCECFLGALYVVEYFYSLLNSIYRACATRRRRRRPQGKSAFSFAIRYI